MTYTIRFLVTRELKEKFYKLQKSGINVSQILRRFLEDYPCKDDDK